MGRNTPKVAATSASSGNAAAASRQNWTAAQHAERTAARSTKKKSNVEKTARQQQRRRILSHETKEKRDDLKLKLHITRVTRELTALRERLQAWDPVEEAKRAKQEAQEADRKRRAEQDAASGQTKKKRQRKGPETWKLKGAARPAWEVYDFDTRYVDPHVQAHEHAKAKAQRSVNILAVYKGKLGDDSDTNIPEAARQYLALLMQLGFLQHDARKFKSARAAWMECMELEGRSTPITTARESLMRLYLQLKRTTDVLKLGEELVAKRDGDNGNNDVSVWIHYSLALVALQQQHPKATEYLVSAITAHPLTAYYLAFYDIFDSAMEYTHDLEDADNEPESSLEEAIEYCTSGQEQAWQQGDHAATLRTLLPEAVQGQHAVLSPSDVDWNDRLVKLEQALSERQRLREVEEAGYYGPGVDSLRDGEEDTSDSADKKEAKHTEAGESNGAKVAASATSSDEAGDGPVDGDDDVEGGPIDIFMYLGMFRTAMEMVEEEGFAVTPKKK